MDTSNIRTARIEDIDEIVALLVELFTQEVDFQPDVAKQYRAVEQILNEPEHGHILVISIQEKIVGIVSLLYLISTAEGGKVAMLEDMVISSNYRQQGLGKKLLDHAIDFASQQNCTRITLLTDADNQTGQAFYQQAGFAYSAMLPMRLKLSPAKSA